MTRDPDAAAETFQVRVRADGGPAPTEGGAEERLDAERASATPLWHPEPRREGAQPPDAGRVEHGVEGPLRELQAWFSAVMTHPESAAAGIEAARPIQAALGAPTVEHVVKPNSRMDAAARMAVYQHGYHSRLVDCVKDDFDAVGHALGKARFHEACLRYVHAYPSDGPNLNIYARHFPAFLATQGEWLPEAAFLSELARLEWAMIEVVHAAEGPRLDTSALQAAPPEAWAGLRLFPSPTFRFETFSYPVNAYFQAVMDGQDPPVPEPRWAATAIYRRGWRIWRMGFTPAMAAVLQALLTGAPLGEALARLEDEALEGEDDTADTDVMKWFSEWVESGFFARLELGAS